MIVLNLERKICTRLGWVKYRFHGNSREEQLKRV